VTALSCLMVAYILPIILKLFGHLFTIRRGKHCRVTRVALSMIAAGENQRYGAGGWLNVVCVAGVCDNAVCLLLL